MIGYLYAVTLSIIIVNYNVKDLLEQCLRSVQAAATTTIFEVYVIDNASTDGSVEYLSARFPEFHFIRNETNVGFARANNQALLLCSGEFVLFLNPDTFLPPGALDQCVLFMRSNPEAGALGVRMVNGNNEFLKESKRGLPTAAASFWKLSGVIKFFPRSSYFAKYYAGHLGEFQINRVDVLSGAFMMLRKSVLEKIGGFDERFFMYAEDIDLSYRVLKAGYFNYYFPDVTIVHFKGSSTKKDTRYVIQFYRAMSQYVRKHYGNGPYAWLLDAGIIVRGSVAAISQKLRSRR